VFSEGASISKVSYGTYFFLKGVFLFMAFPPPFTLIVLCGKTGSGKTLLLQHLEETGYPVINLEKIASHRGSAFGGMLLPTQPSQKEFESNIQNAVIRHTPSKYIFIEQKPSSIGKRKIPGWLSEKMKEGIHVQLNVDKKTRVTNILKEYKVAGKENFMEALQKLHQRLTLPVIKEMQSFLYSENYEAFIERMLDYYDNTSQYQAEKKATIVLDVEPGDIINTTKKLLALL